MKRTSTVVVKFADGSTATAKVTTRAVSLMRSESNHQHDAAVDNVVGALRSLPYTETAPLRQVAIR